MTHYQNVLDHYAQLNTPFLHGAGIRGSKHLLSIADFTGNESVFELGCGTGASLVLLKSNFPGLDICGGDLSNTMLSTAQKRLRFCGLNKQIPLYKLHQNQAIPLPDHSKDAVWIESVLAIQDDQQFDFLLKEIHRILKPKGRLILNETVWLPQVTIEQANHLNEECEKAFGIIQANATYARLDNWVNVIKSQGYTVEHEGDVESFAGLEPSFHKWKNNYRSRLFDFLGKAKQFLSPRYRAAHKSIIQKGEQIMSSQVKILNAYLVVARKC